MAKLVFALIDDDEEDHDIFGMAIQVFEPEEIEVTYFLSAGDALNRFTGDINFVPDFIFIDLNMPKMDGQECARELRKLNHLKKSQLCIYTTATNNMVADKAHHFDADHIICKPDSINHLSKTLADLINQS